MIYSSSSHVVRRYLHQVIKDLSFPTSFDDVQLALNNFSQIFTPKLLYRYRECGKKHSFSDIESNQITLTAASEFPDIHDAAIHDMSEMEIMAKRIVNQTSEARAVLYEVLKRAGMSLESESIKQFDVFVDDFFNLPESMQKEALDSLTMQMREAVDIQRYSKSLREQLQIACLCGNPDSRYMWENYGGNGSGYVIEYNTLRLFDVDLNNKQRPLILPVIYADPLPDTFLLPVAQTIEPIACSVMREDVFKGMKAINLIKCIFYKQIDPFAKEEEWRLQLTPQKCEEGAQHIFRNISPSRLLAGPTMNERDRRRLQKCGRINNIPVEEMPLKK